jgi:predicted esterase
MTATGGGPGTGGSGTGGRVGATGGAAGRTAIGGGATAGTATTATGGNPGQGGTRSTGTGTQGEGGAKPSSGCGKATTAKSGNGLTLNVGGSDRTYNLKIPDDYDMNKAYRLMLSLHGGGETADQISSNGYYGLSSFYGLLSLSQGSTIFVAPQGNDKGWSNTGGSDVAFLRQLITQLESQLCIDESRIFCEGHSFGGSMSYAMASAAPDIIRAVAVHSGGTMSGTTPGHNKPVAYFMTHGTKHSVCTYPQYGVPQLQDFAKVNGCKTPDPTLSATAFEAALPEPTGSAGACVSFEGCLAPVRACIFVGKHTPNPAGNWVPAEVWKFISQF